MVNSSQTNADDLPEEPTEFDMSSLFDLIADHVELPSKQSCQTPPPYVVRVIFVYGRSKGKLLLNKEKEVIFCTFFVIRCYLLFDVIRLCHIILFNVV